PHLIKLQDDGSSCGLLLLLIVLGQGEDPGEHSLGGDAEEKRDPVHRHATEVPQHGADLHREGLAARGRTGKLVTALFTLLLRLASSGAVFDKPITLASGTAMHRYLPSPTWISLFREGSITTHRSLILEACSEIWKFGL